MPGAEPEHHRDHRGERRQAERCRQRPPAGSGPPPRRAARRSASRPSPHPERNRSVSSTIAISTPMSSPTGAVLLGRQVDQDAARLDLDLRLGGLGGRDQRLAVVLRDVPGVGGVAHVDRRQAPVLARPGRRPRTGSPPARRRRACGPSRARPRSPPSAPGSETLPSSTVKTSVESTPPNAGECAWKRSIAFWDSAPGSGVVVAGFSLAPAARTSSTRTPTAAARLRFQCEDRVRAMRARSWDMLVPFERGSTERVRAIPPGQRGTPSSMATVSADNSGFAGVSSQQARVRVAHAQRGGKADDGEQAAAVPTEPVRIRWSRTKSSEVRLAREEVGTAGPAAGRRSRSVLDGLTARHPR